MPRTALFVRIYEDWDGDARLYLLSEPVKAKDGRFFRKIIVSKGTTGDMPETIIYAANEDGTMASMDPLQAIFHECSHHAALLRLGYEMEVGVRDGGWMTERPDLEQCPAALNIKGEHFPCDTPIDKYTGKLHDGWIHGNKEAGAIWCGSDAPVRLPG